MNKHIQPHVGIMKLFFQINDVWRQPTDFFFVGWLRPAVLLLLLLLFQIKYVIELVSGLKQALC